MRGARGIASPGRTRKTIVTYAFGGGSSGAGSSARGTRSANREVTTLIGVARSKFSTRDTRGVTTQDVTESQHGTICAASFEPWLPCSESGAHATCVIGAAAGDDGHAATLPTMMKCIIASRANAPSHRRDVMSSKLISRAAVQGARPAALADSAYALTIAACVFASVARSPSRSLFTAFPRMLNNPPLGRSSNFCRRTITR